MIMYREGGAMKSKNLEEQSIGPTVIAQADAKNQAQEIIRTLTLLNTSVAYLDDPISKSNQLLSKIASQVQNIKHKNPFIEKIYVYLFSHEREQFYSELTEYSEELTHGVNKAKDLLVHITACVDQLSSLINEISDETMSKDYQGIVSVNRLKIATIEQGINFANKHLNAIDKYRTVTLYHLNDAVPQHPDGQVDKVDNGYEVLSNEFHSRERKIKHFNLQCLRFCFAFGILSIVNGLASNYYITWTSTKFRDLITSPENFKGGLPIERLFDALQLLFIFGALAVLFPITLIIAKAVRSGISPVNTVNLMFCVVVGIGMIFGLGGAFSGSNVEQESYQVVNSITFFNLGEYFTRITATASIMCVFPILAMSYLSKDFFKAKMLFNNLQITSEQKKQPSK